MFAKFEQDLRAVLETCVSTRTNVAEDMWIVSSNAPLPAEAPGAKLQSTTVVLYFDHLVHDTPDDHVESRARVTTCMHALRSQKAHDEKGRSYPIDRYVQC